MTKETYDAITKLWELGVASGISDTGYAPASSIRRDHMAGFMAGVMDHSNLRPAGLSIQASETSGYGTVEADVVVSVRDAMFMRLMFMPVADQLVDVFSSDVAGGGLDRHGKCVAASVVGDCVWDNRDEITDENGNISDPDASAGEGTTAVHYAWIGDETGDKFDREDVDHVSVSINAMSDEQSVKVDTGIPMSANAAADEAGNDYDSATNSYAQVDLRSTSSVTISLQLKSQSDGEGSDVSRAGVKFTVNTITGLNRHDGAAVIETDESGKASFTVQGLSDDRNADDQQRLDAITFEYQGTDVTRTDDDATGYDQLNGTPDPQTEVTVRIAWIETPRVVTSVSAVPDPYIVVGASGTASVNTVVTFYDQYGKSFRQQSGQRVGVTFASGTEMFIPVNHRGVAKANSGTLTGREAGTPITMAYTEDPDESTTAVSGDPALAADIDLAVSVEDDLDNASGIQVVGTADTGAHGVRNVHTLFADDNLFTVEGTAAEASSANAGLLYSYDENDTYLAGATGATITMEKFEEYLANQPGGAANASVVDVIVYSDTGGSSIFQVTAKSDGTAP